MPVAIADAEAGGAADRVDRAVAEHAIRLGRSAGGVQQAPGRRLDRGGAEPRRVVDDQAAAGDAAQLGERGAPVRHVHQQPDADGHVEAAIGERQVLRIAAQQADRRGRAGHPRLADAQHLARVVEAGDASAARGQGQRRARRAGADVEHGGAGDVAGERGDHARFLFGDELADRAAEAQRVEALGDVRVRVVFDAVVGRLHATPRATWAAPLPKSSA